MSYQTITIKTRRWGSDENASVLPLKQTAAWQVIKPYKFTVDIRSVLLLTRRTRSSGTNEDKISRMNCGSLLYSFNACGQAEHTTGNRA